MITSGAVTGRALWGHSVLSLLQIPVDTLYNYKERETPEGFNPDATLTAFYIYTTDKASLPRLQPLQINNVNDGLSLDIKFHHVRRPAIHVWDSDITGLRLNYEGSAWFKWDDNKAMFCDLLVNKFAKTLSDPNLYPTGVTPLWVLRSFFIGPDTRRCPPYITVMCSDEQLSRDLVDYIHRKLQKRHLKGFSNWGVTRLPNVHISQYGSPTASPSNNAEEFPQSEEKDKCAQEIGVHLTERGLPFTMPNDITREFWDKQQYSCGIRLKIFQDWRVYRHGTIGGLVHVGESIFGLTVSHVFPRVDSEHSAPSSGLGEQQENSEVRMDDSRTKGHQWHNPLKQSMAFDWGLVEMPSLEAQQQHPESWNDVNLVKTTSGDFRPVLVVQEMPSNGTPVVLATPGPAFCLRGLVTGEDAFVNMPESPNPYITWVLRMDQPWLITSGDSGSWAFDAGSGDLLGILVAGCPELHEAYIIPAYQVFGDISRILGKDVRLPNCYPTTDQDVQELTRLEKTIFDFMSELSLKSIDISVFDLERIDNGAATCFTRAQAILSNGQHDLLNYRNRQSDWVSPYQLQRRLDAAYQRRKNDIRRFKHALTWLDSEDIRHCEDLLSESRLPCFNFVSMNLRRVLFHPPSTGPGPDRYVPAFFWAHFMLGEESLGLDESEFSTAGYPISQVIEVERRSCTHRSQVNLPRDRRSILAALEEMEAQWEHQISEVREIHYATLPEKASFDLENVKNPMILIAVLLNESEDGILVLDPPTDADRSWRFLGLPCIQVNEALDEEQNLELLLSTKMGLENTSYDQAEKLELEARNSRFWLEGHNIYIDVAAYKVILSEEEWKSTSSRLYEMDVVGVDLEYAAKKVSGWHYVRILQFLGYRRF